jgi:hypothetical protein
MPLQRGQRLQCNEDKDANTTMATMPAQQGQKDHNNGGTIPMMAMPVQRGWQREATMVKVLLQQRQWHQSKDSKDASAMTATTPLQGLQQCQRNDGKDASMTRACHRPWYWQESYPS